MNRTKEISPHNGRKLTYFASDFHLGAEGVLSSNERERQIVQWLEEIRSNCARLYLVGDVFDYWFEYKKVIPKGYVRFLGKLAELSDQGVEVHFFMGNHDMWVKDYFTTEMGIIIHDKPKTIELDSKMFLVAHGDGLGPGDISYKIIKRIIRNPFLQQCFSLLPTRFGLWLMKSFSQKSRDVQEDEPISDWSKEWLVQYCESELVKRRIDYFIFGHRHKPIRYLLNNKESYYINLGDWLEFCTYAVWDGNQLSLRFYNNDGQKEIYSNV